MGGILRTSRSTIDEVRRNWWGHEISPPQEVAGIGSMQPLLKGLLCEVGSRLGVSQSALPDLVDTALSPTVSRLTEVEYESLLKSQFKSYGDSRATEGTIEERSQIIATEIAPLIVGKTVLDIGCGNGLVAKRLATTSRMVQLVDVVRYVRADVELPYAHYKEGQRLPFAESFDTTLLLTVLHHSNDPLLLLREAWRLTGQRLIIIESVFGAPDAHLSEQYALAGRSREEQLGYAIYVDWLYNRVLNDNIPVPYNFTTPPRWVALFQEEGMHLVEESNLGQDIPVAPELHFLFVLEK